MSECPPPNTKADQARTADQYYDDVSIAIKQGEFDKVKSKLASWREDQSIPGPTQEEIDYLVLEAAKDAG